MSALGQVVSEGWPEDGWEKKGDAAAKCIQGDWLVATSQYDTQTIDRDSRVTKKRRKVLRSEKSPLKQARAVAGNSGPMSERTHCPSGHEYSEINTYVSPAGHRKCRKCGLEAYKRYRDKVQG